MSTKDDYTVEEWAKVTNGPMAAGMYVIVASPGLTSIIGESKAMMEAMATGEVPADAADLVGSIMADMKEMVENKEKMETLELPEEAKKDPEAAKASLLGQVKEASGAVQAKGSAGEAAGYGQWVMGVANATAEAAKEGGFMGIGGQRVSPEEKAALANLENALS